MSNGCATVLQEGADVGVLGGTGPQCLGLSQRLASAGVPVIISSQSADRASEAAAGLPGQITGADNKACADACAVAVVAVPYGGHRTRLSASRTQLAGKVVIGCVNPLSFDSNGPSALEVPDGSACEEAQAVPAESIVTGAFHHLSAVHLLDPERAEINSDVLVVGDDRKATDLTQHLAERITGVRAIFAGRLRNAHQVEAMTANSIAINRRYKAHAGIRSTTFHRSALE